MIFQIKQKFVQCMYVSVYVCVCACKFKMSKCNVVVQVCLQGNYVILIAGLTFYCTLNVGDLRLSLDISSSLSLDT